MLSSYFWHKWALEAERLRQEAEVRAATAEARLEAIKAQLERATAPRRRNRRRSLR